MLISSTFFLVIALIAFLVWATRPPKTHRNKLQSFSLNFESKRIEFAKQPNGLYQVNLCTKHFDELEASKWETSQRKGRKLVFEKISKKLQKHYFTDDKAIELSDKLLTEKQATKLYFQLLKTSKSQSVCNAFYISKLIESIGKPKIFTVKRVQKFQDAKRNAQARFQARKASETLPSSPAPSAKGRLSTQNSIMVLSLFLMSNTEKQVIEVLQNESELTLIMLLIAILGFGVMYKRLCNYLQNECIS